MYDCLTVLNNNNLLLVRQRKILLLGKRRSLADYSDLLEEIKFITLLVTILEKIDSKYWLRSDSFG